MNSSPGRYLVAVAALLLLVPAVRAREDEPEDRKGRFLKMRTPSVISVLRFNHPVDFELLGVSPYAGMNRSDPLEKEAREFVAALLKDKQVVIQIDEAVPHAPVPHTYIGYVSLEDGTCINEELLRRGYANVKEDPAFSRLGQFLEIVREARARKVGMWAREDVSKTMTGCDDGRIAFAGACGVTNPALIPESKTVPRYPKKARKSKIEGRVILRAVVTKDGTVTDVVGVSSPNEEMTASAIEAVKTWRYRPALKEGVPIDVLFTVVVDYFLK